MPRTDFFTPYTTSELIDIDRAVRSLTLCAESRSIGADIPIVRARFSSDGRVAVACERFRDPNRCRLRIFDARTGARYDSHHDDVPESCQFAFTHRDQDLIVTGLGTGAEILERPVWQPAGHAKEVWGLCFSRDGRTLISSSDDHMIKLWNMASGRVRQTLLGHESLVMSVAISPDGKLLASAGWDKTVRIWKLSDGTALATLIGHRDHVRAVAFSVDGTMLASGGNDWEIRLWGVATLKQLVAPLVDHVGCVNSLAFAKDGKTLFSSAGDKTIRLWDLETGRLRATWTASDMQGPWRSHPTARRLPPRCKMEN